MQAIKAFQTFLSSIKLIMSTPIDQLKLEQVPTSSQEYEQNTVEGSSSQTVIDKEKEMAELLITMDNYTPIVSFQFFDSLSKILKTDC